MPFLCNENGFNTSQLPQSSLAGLVTRPNRAYRLKEIKVALLCRNAIQYSYINHSLNLMMLIANTAKSLLMWFHEPDVRRSMTIGAIVLLLHVVAIRFVDRTLRIHPPVRPPIFMVTHVVMAPPQAIVAKPLAQKPAQTSEQRQASSPAWLLAVSDAPLKLRTGIAPTHSLSAIGPETARLSVAGQNVSSYSPTVSTDLSLSSNGSNNSINNARPVLPEISRALGQSGQVIVRVLVDANGHLQQVRLLHSSGFDRLDQIALETVKQWRFEPDLHGGKAHKMWLTLPVNFRV